MTDKPNNVEYTAAPTLSVFHNSNTFMRGIIGPIGSGKSVACVVEILVRAQQQEPSPDGKRKSRIAVVRNTYRELIDTTIQTFRDWIPKQCLQWSAQDMKHTIKFNDVECEVLFRALDRPGDVKKLLSLELTCAWVNEAREIPKPVVDMLAGRVGRYPSMREGGPTWYGIWMDTNPPDSDHWWYKSFEEIRPDEWRLFHQPSAVGGKGENLENLPEKYYERLSSGKSKLWKDVYVHGKYGFIQEHAPVWPEYNDEVHTANDVLEYLPGLDVFVGIDFGLTPAATIAQKNSFGQWRIIQEVVTERMGAQEFAKELGIVLRGKYFNSTVIITGDPGGDEGSQNNDETVFQVLEANGVSASPAYTNDFTIRRECVVTSLKTMTMNGEPALLVSPACKMLRKGMCGAYYYKRVQVAGDERYQDKPYKGPYSHVCESLQYLLLGAGEGYSVVGQDGEDFFSEPAVNADLERWII